MSNGQVLVNLRKTAKGLPKGSFTVHLDPGCRSASGRPNAKPHLWAKTTASRVGKFSSQILFGVCTICSGSADSGDADQWQKNGPPESQQMKPEDAKRKLED